MENISGIKLKMINIRILCIIMIVFIGQSIYCQSANTIIADHTIVDQYNQIPQEWINEVKKMLICIPGESHGRAYIYALELLEAMDSTYSVNATWFGKPEDNTDQHVRITRTYWSGTGWPPSCGEEHFYTNATARTRMENHLIYMKNTQNNPVTAFGFGWCWDMTWHNLPGGEVDPVYGVRWAGSSVGGPEGDLRWGIDDEDSVLTGNSVNLYTYINAIESYNNLDVNTISFFTTGPVDGNHGTEAGYQRYLKHQEIRQHVQDNGGALFDYADILCWDYMNNQYYIDNWEGHDFQNGNTELATGGVGYDGGDGGCHINEEACLMLGKAMWWMLARIAGWDGGHGGTGIDELSIHPVSDKVELLQNYPNPFNYETTIEYKLFEQSKIDILISDISGKQVKIIYSGIKKPGIHSIEMNCNDLSPGIYFIKLTDDSQTVVKKCLIKK